MAISKCIFNLFVVVVAALVCIVVTVEASPVGPVAEAPTNMREGRFYGLGGAQASAIASANAGGYGMGGYPYGGGLASSTAIASANAGSFGYGK